MKKLKAIRSVYSYYFPEIRDLITGLTKKYPHEVFLYSIFPGLDDFHLPIIKKYLNFISPYTLGLDKFPYHYFTNGSSEGIFHLLAYFKTKEPQTPIYVLKGEYEGYEEYGKNLNINVQEIDLSLAQIPSLKKGLWFISNPSARNGNIIPNQEILKICQSGHRVIIDGAYFGLTKRYSFNLNQPNIVAVVTSLSKPLGLFYYRIGFAFTRFEMPTLEPNKWFKNIFSLIIADKIFSQFKADYFYKKYKPIQEKIIKKINQETGLGMKISEALLLGFLDKKASQKLDKQQLEEISRLKRGDFYRFCLTPYFLEEENNSRKKIDL